MQQLRDDIAFQQHCREEQHLAERRKAKVNDVRRRGDAPLCQRDLRNDEMIRLRVPCRWRQQRDHSRDPQCERRERRQRAFESRSNGQTKRTHRAPDRAQIIAQPERGKRAQHPEHERMDDGEAQQKCREREQTQAHARLKHQRVEGRVELQRAQNAMPHRGGKRDERARDRHITKRVQNRQRVLDAERFVDDVIIERDEKNPRERDSHQPHTFHCSTSRARK